jgi:crotonobetainyl-CoA:carnitine CoA-transferase CaiB-like acyl-CoA transferase
MQREDDPQMGPVPMLGQHTNAILDELGFSGAQIDSMKSAGAV